MSPREPEGSLLSRPFMPIAAIMKRFLAPLLSAQLMVAATGRPVVTRSLTPTRPAAALLMTQLVAGNIININ